MLAAIRFPVSLGLRGGDFVYGITVILPSRFIRRPFLVCGGNSIVISIQAGYTLTVLIVHYNGGIFIIGNRFASCRKWRA